MAVGLYYAAAAISTVGLMMGYKFARYTWHMHDFVIGHMLFVILFILSALQFPSTIQVRVGGRFAEKHAMGFVCRIACVLR